MGWWNWPQIVPPFDHILHSTQLRKFQDFSICWVYLEYAFYTYRKIDNWQHFICEKFMLFLLAVNNQASCGQLAKSGKRVPAAPAIRLRFSTVKMYFALVAIKAHNLDLFKKLWSRCTKNWIWKKITLSIERKGHLAQIKAQWRLTDVII